MTKTFKIIIIAAIVLFLAALGLVFWMTREKSESVFVPETITNNAETESEISPTEPTSNVDDAAQGLLNEENLEEKDIEEEMSDADLLDLDSQEIGGLSGVYNENEF